MSTSNPSLPIQTKILQRKQRDFLVYELEKSYLYYCTPSEVFWVVINQQYVLADFILAESRTMSEVASRVISQRKSCMVAL